MIRVGPCCCFFGLFFFGGGVDYCMMIEIAQMALSYYLILLLKHNGQNDPENAAQARSASCRTVQSIQMIPSSKRM